MATPQAITAKCGRHYSYTQRSLRPQTVTAAHGTIDKVSVALLNFGRTACTHVDFTDLEW